MAYIGLKHPVFAPIATEPANALPSYSAGLVVGRAIGANVSIELSESKLTADDVVVETDNSFVGGTITAQVDDLTDDVLTAWLGATEVTEGEEPNTITVIRDSATKEAPVGGFGYYRIRKKDGVRTIRAYWYYKTKWGIKSEEAKTKPDGSVEWQTPEVEGLIMTAQDADSTWRDMSTFTTEAAAVAWLNGKAGIV